MVRSRKKRGAGAGRGGGNVCERGKEKRRMSIRNDQCAVSIESRVSHSGDWERRRARRRPVKRQREKIYQQQSSYFG